MDLKAAVVLTIYNGAKYIVAQLDSIRSQTRKPDEVIILDDCSKDNSVNLVSSFIAQYHLNSWHIIINEKNVGWKANFMKGFALAEKDNQIIFCSDQDDVWNCKKIEEMLQIMEENPKINVLACNLTVFYENEPGVLRAGKSTLAKYGKTDLALVSFDKRWIEPKRPGCSYCFRSSFLGLLESVWFSDCPHDLLLWAAGVATGSLYIVNRPLLSQRRHQTVSTPSNVKNQGIRCRNLEIQRTLTNNLLSKYDVFDLSKSQILFLQKYSFVLTERIKAISNKNFWCFLLLLFRLKYYPKPTSWLGDLKSSFHHE